MARRGGQADPPDRTMNRTGLFGAALSFATLCACHLERPARQSPRLLGQLSDALVLPSPPNPRVLYRSNRSLPRHLTFPIEGGRPILIRARAHLGSSGIKVFL